MSGVYGNGRWHWAVAPDPRPACAAPYFGFKKGEH
jgi:hypothetical protein